MGKMLFYLEIFFLSFIISLVLTPLSKFLSYKIGALDQPGPRKIHTQPMPRLGGLAIFTAFWFSLFFISGINHFRYSNSIYVIFLGSLLLFLLGIFDDIFNFRAWIKLLIQIFIGLLITAFGVRIEFINNPFNGLIILGVWAIPLSIIWIFAIANALNYADGLDGLAAGLCAIAATALFIVALRTNRFEPAMLTLALAGCCLGFLRFNFYPASIFMGDSGSTFLGYMLAVSSIIGVLKSTIFIALAVPLLALGLPIFDITFVTLRRLRNGQHIFEPDKTHLHHRLLAIGLPPLKTLWTLYFVSFVLSLGAVLVSFTEGWLSILIILLMAIFGGGYLVGVLRTKKF